jgi:tetratricopeptide (TPR) repeat protein
MKKGRKDEAITEFREAIRLKKNFAEAHCSLGAALYDKGHLDAAIAESREAIRLKHDYAEAHSNLGAALYDKGQRDAAIAEYREALRLKKDLASAHNNLGRALVDKGRLDEAIPEFHEAIHLENDAVAHNNLGAALATKGQIEKAIAAFREAIRLRKDYADAHDNLGMALRDTGQLEEAIAAFREAVRLQKDFVKARNNLRQAKQMARLDSCLPRILEGKDQPKDAAERLAYAWLCQQNYRKSYAVAAHFYIDAFADEPDRASDLDAQHRYNAACAAALAGCGQGKDADKLDTKERARLRQQALDWLRADLKAYRQVMEKAADKTGPMIAQRMQRWLQDQDFAGVRGDKALVKLPEAERKDWQKLWEEVQALRQRATKQR